MAHYTRLVRKQVAKLVRAVVANHHALSQEMRKDLASVVRAAQQADRGMRPAVDYVALGLRKVRKMRVSAEDYGREPPYNFACGFWRDDF